MLECLKIFSNILDKFDHLNSGHQKSGIQMILVLCTYQLLEGKQNLIGLHSQRTSKFLFLAPC